MNDYRDILIVCAMQSFIVVASLVTGALIAFKLMRPGQTFWQEEVISSGNTTDNPGSSVISDDNDDSESRRSLDELLDS